MQRWLAYVLTFALAAGLSAWLTPRVREAAVRFGIVDRPDGKLKTQSEPVPYLGGIAICLAFLLALALNFALPFDRRVLGLLLAGSIVVILGLIDDLGGLRPWTKLLGQVVAVLVLVKAGMTIQLVVLSPLVAVPLSVVWLLATTNAFNLIDIMDGLSSGTAMIAALALLVVADLDGNVSSATVLAAVAGACLGFLRYNFQPARIYMGDTGSMFLGLLLGALSMDNAYTQRNPVAALAPAMILGVPLFDMLFVMYVRWRRGLPVMLGSPDHVALRLRRWRLSTRQTVLLSYGVTAVLGAAAVGMTRLPSAGALCVVGSLAAAALVSAVLLRRIDMGL
ncbi:MAG TPA: MraY family glycosyltransferase [Candidatus Polarisedimenticolaceae bacterium]|nr:MraY family glycosyltransferase [Candidatus Polarisedimenticolaceae bacterium]